MSPAATSQRFLYRAMSAGAGMTEGEIESVDHSRAQDELRRRGLVVLDLRPAGASRRSARGPAARSRAGATRAAAAEDAPTRSFLGRKPLADPSWKRVRAEMFAELALLVDGGMSLDAALDAVSGVASKPAHERTLRSLAADVRQGRTLAEGLRRLPDHFEAHHVALVQAGEDSGRLPEVLRRLNQQEERAARLTQQLVSALMYPSILIVVGTFILAAIVSFVVPRFSAIFEEMDIKLPVFSAVVIAICRFLGAWGPLLLVALLAGMIVLRTQWGRPDRRRAIERWLLEKSPAGPLWWKHQTAAFSGAMAMMLSSGVPILRALEIARTTWRSEELRARLDGVISSMREGGRLSESVRSARLLPERSDKLLTVGEEGGRLAQVFDKMAESLENDVSLRTRRALTLLEPLAILAITAVVGPVIIALILAIFSINNLNSM